MTSVFSEPLLQAKLVRQLFYIASACFRMVQDRPNAQISFYPNCLIASSTIVLLTSIQPFAFVYSVTHIQYNPFPCSTAV